jgi:UDP-glucose 4-epimerase
MKTEDAGKILVTGAAGFIGSHLVDRLMNQGAFVCAFDNLSSGTPGNVGQWLDDPDFTFIRGDLLDRLDLRKLGRSRYEIIYHLAANPEVRVGTTNPNIHFQQNIVATKNLLEFIRKTQQNPTLVFSSTSTVYGEPNKIPTPEDYSPLMPISIYGATKLACEALTSAYARTYSFKAIIYRLANIVGPRNRHGVIHDFIQKLKKNPRELEILGDGTQNKSYLHIDDCVEAMLCGVEKTKTKVETYNVGSEDQISVKAIAQTLLSEMKLKNVKLRFTGGVDGGRGWIGDVKNMLLDINKLRSLEWKPKHNSKQAVAKTAKQLAEAPTTRTEK